MDVRAGKNVNMRGYLLAAIRGKKKARKIRSNSKKRRKKRIKKEKLAKHAGFSFFEKSIIFHTNEKRKEKK